MVRLFLEGVADEQGLYKYEFELPAEWNGKQIELVFEGSMTDTQVKIMVVKLAPCIRELLPLYL